jgi:hypothetical protein
VPQYRVRWIIIARNYRFGIRLGLSLVSGLTAWDFNKGYQGPTGGEDDGPGAA